MDELRADLREIKLELRRISDTLVRNTASLEVHEKRTSISEKRIEQLEGQTRWLLGVLVSCVMAIAVKLFIR